ncbi:MAG: hypothetical protein U5K37_08800 [Natrialbaceae archaeon]|nr:hypothetical protein [Natrialbaceae archaeon]
MPATENDTGATVTFRVTPPASTSLVYGPADQTDTFTPNTKTELNLSATLDGAQAPNYNLSLPNNGDAYPIGWPGAVNDSITDAFPEGIDGVSSIYRYTTDGWKQVNDPDYTPSALEGLVITTSGEGPATIPVQVRLQNGTTPGNATLNAGWNLVAAPAYTDAEDAFGGGIAETLMVLQQYGIAGTVDHPVLSPSEPYVIGSTQWGETPPTVSPLMGYFVYTTGPTDLPIRATDIDHKTHADDLLGLP